MKNNKSLIIAVVILLFAIIGISIYSIHQYSNTRYTINQLELGKIELSKKLDSLQVNLKTKNMAAYVIFIKEKTTNQQELDIYAKEAPAGLAGHNIILLRKQKHGMKIPYTKKQKNIVLKEEYTGLLSLMG